MKYIALIVVPLLISAACVTREVGNTRVVTETVTLMKEVSVAVVTWVTTTTHTSTKNWQLLELSPHDIFYLNTDLCKTYRHSPRKRESMGRCNLRERPSARIIAVLLSFAKVSSIGVKMTHASDKTDSRFNAAADILAFVWL